MPILKRVRSVVSYIFDFLMTIAAIVLIIAFSQTYTLLFQPDFWSAFWNVLKEIGYTFLFFDYITVQVSEFDSLDLIGIIKGPLWYSLVILVGGLSITFLVALFFEFIHYFFPPLLKKVVRGMAFVIQSIPDVIMIFSLQLFTIWIYKRTGVLVIDPIAGFDKVYLMPILTLSILPVIMLFQMIDLSVSEEEDKLYVNYAYAKGFSKQYIFFVHILRNTVLTLFSNLQLLFWLMISNLLILEILFNVNGFMKLVRQIMFEPDIFAVTLTCLFLPFYLVDVLGKFVVKKMNGDTL